MLNFVYCLLLVTVSSNTCTGPCDTLCSITCPACIEKTICQEIVPLVEVMTLLENDSTNATEDLATLCLDIIPHSVFARMSYTVSCTTEACTPVVCDKASCAGGGDTSCNVNCDECADDTAICSIVLDKLEILASNNTTGIVYPLVVIVKESIATMCSSAAIGIQPF